MRRIAVIVAVWAVVVGGALLMAVALDDPVGEGARDAAQPVAPSELADPTQGGGLAEELPPLALVLDRPLPPDVAALPPIRQVARLSERARGSDEARRWVELGAALQVIGDGTDAAAAYRRALRAGGDDVAADTGLALVRATQGADGPEVAAARLSALAAANPDDQLVAFNQGWLAVYRRDSDGAIRSWERTVAIDPDSRLGLAAVALIRSLEEGPSGREP